jgi:iron(III) transport system ATP-binding protein
VLALLGPSGCGKTTLLKILAGLEQPSHGEVWMGGRCVASASQSLPPERRDLGMVFQDCALWPHMSVQANVAFPLEMRGLPREQIHQRVQQTLGLVGLQGMGERAPSSLSGGQQQRVALARAVVERPRLVLFDEPLSNLDRDLRESLCLEMSQLLRSLGCTAVYATHDHGEACVMADRVAVMNHGRIQPLDTPHGLWSAPAHCDVAQFLKLAPLSPPAAMASAG